MQKPTSNLIIEIKMKTGFILVIASALLTVSCNQSKYPELTNERFQELVASLPDHYMKLDTALYTPEYYNAWTESWAIPGGGLGDMGFEEFLFYFVCGNDPCPKHTGKLISMKTEADTAYVDFNIIHRASQTPHTLKLVVRNGSWVIADFDQTLTEMQTYLVEQRIYLQSKEYRDHAQSILDDPKAGDDWKNLVRDELKEVEKYLSTHK